MKCIENISLEIKVFKSLFIQIIDGLNFGHIYDDYVEIWKCLSKSRRIFLKASISPGLQGQQSGDQSSPREFVCVCLCVWSLPGNKAGGGNKNITVLWVVMLLLSRHNQNSPKEINKTSKSLQHDNNTFWTISNVSLQLTVNRSVSLLLILCWRQLKPSPFFLKARKNRRCYK